MKFLYPILTLLILPLIAMAWLLKKVVVIFKKSSKNGMIYLKDEGKKVLYSPYFEYEAFFQETKLLVKLVITLSNEGLQKNTHAPLTSQAQNSKKSKHIFREATLFLINQGETPVEITAKFLEIDGEDIYKLDSEAQLIAAGHYHECEPAMAIDAEDRRQFKAKIVLEYKDEMHEINCEVNRMRVSDMDEKYKVETGEQQHGA